MWLHELHIAVIKHRHMKYKDHYATLGIPRNAAQDAVKKAYRKLARRYHPDVSLEPLAELRFKEVGEAYAVLRDPDRRAAYDLIPPPRTTRDEAPSPRASRSYGDDTRTDDSRSGFFRR